MTIQNINVEEHLLIGREGEGDEDVIIWENRIRRISVRINIYFDGIF